MFSRVSTLFLLIITGAAFVYIYQVQIGPANGYLGMRPLIFGMAGFIVFLLAFLYYLFLPFFLKFRPSDFFLIVYSLVPIFSYVILYPVSGVLSDWQVLFGYALLIIPVFLLLLFRSISTKFYFKGFLSSWCIDLLACAVGASVVIFSLYKMMPWASFSLSDSYVRRLIGRDIFPAGTISAYANSIVMNGFVPFLAYRGATGRSLLLIPLALAFVVSYYYTLGVKAPFLYFFFFLSLGFFLENGGGRGSFFKVYLGAVLSLFLTSLVMILEGLLFGGYSYVADYLFRRLYAVPPQLMGYYIDYFGNSANVNWNFLTGSLLDAKPISFIVGDVYSGQSGTNANSNSFFYALGEYGFIGYLLNIIFIIIIYFVLDCQYKNTRNKSYLFLGMLFGVLLLEQFYATALVSSGVAVLLLLVLFEKKE